MGNHIDWDNIHLHMDCNDVRYKRRLYRKQLYIACSSSSSTNTTNTATVNDHLLLACPNLVPPKKPISPKTNHPQNVNFLCNDAFWVECSNAVGNSEPTSGNVAHFDIRGEPVRVNKRNYVDPDMEIFRRENEELMVRQVVDVASRDVDPDYKIFEENLRVDVHSFGLNIKNMDGSMGFLMYEKDDFCKENPSKMKADNVKNVAVNQKGDAAKKLRNNVNKRKRGKVLPRVDVDFVSTKETSNAMVCRDSVYDDNLQPRYKCDKRFRKYAEGKKKNANSLNYDKKDSEHSSVLVLRKSKKQHGKLERRPCLTRADNVSDPIDIAGKAKRHLAVLSRKSANYRRTIPRNERRDLVVQQGEDIENSMFSSGIGNMAVMVKEEKFDDSTDVVLVEKSMQMIPGRDSVKFEKKFGKYAKVREENAKSLNYDEEDNEDSSDLEILDADNQQDLSKFEVTKVLDASVVEDNPLSMKISSDYETSVFREELMDILRRPYNLEEYRSLMQKAKYRHLNWGPEYSDGLKGKEVPNTYGKSPLDYHPDVQRRLRRCRKISKRLNILRGFIYWYGRTCQDGAFKPWLDKSCLAISPCPR